MTSSQIAAVSPAAGWRVRSESAPRGLAGANGMRIGPDGGLYVVSAFGGEVARVDTRTGETTIVSPLGDGIVSPDDIAFGPDGVLYVAECMNARVTAFQDGRTWAVANGLLGANGIDVFEGRMFVDQFLPDGKLWEVFLDGRDPVLLADGLAGPNGLCGAPDGHVYFVQVFTGQVMRVPMDGGVAEEVAGGLAAPCSVRSAHGLIYVGHGGDGKVSTLDPQTGELTTIAQARPGIDSLAIDAEGRVFISYYVDGGVYEILSETEMRELVPPGLLGPYGVAATPSGVHIADGLAASRLREDGNVEAAGKFTDEGFPGYLRGLAATPVGRALLATTSEGRVARYHPDTVTSELLADGLAEPMGVAATEDGSAVVAEAGAGRVVRVSAGRVEAIADGFTRPVGVAVAPDGATFVSDEARGTVERIDGDGRRTLLDGLDHPHDLCIADRRLHVLEAGAGRLLSVALDGGDAEVTATGLPVGTGNGVRGTLGGLPEMIPGPISPFAGLDADAEGRLYVGGDARGVVVVLERGGR